MSSFKPGFVLLVLTQVSDLNFEHGNIKFLKPIFYLTVSHLNVLAEDLFIVDNTHYPWKSLLNCAWVTFLIYYIFFPQATLLSAGKYFTIVHVGCLV